MSLAHTDLPALHAAPLAAPGARVPASAVIANIVRGSEAEVVSVAWILSRSPSAAREALMLVLALVAIVPGASLPAGLILMLLAVPMMRNRDAIWLPRAIAARRISVPHLARLIDRVLPLLKWQEGVIPPGGETWVGLSRPVGAATIAILSLTLLVPLPFSNVPPAFAIAMIAVAYLEANILLLAVSALSALVSLALTGSAVWAAMGAARLVLG